MDEASSSDEPAALIRRMRAETASVFTPILVLSSQGSETRRLQRAGPGADDYLIKPFTAAELLARVRSHVSLFEARKKAIEQLLESRTLSVALHQIPVAIMIADTRSGVIIFTNDKLGELFGDVFAGVVTLDDLPEGITFSTDGKPLKRERCPLFRAARLGEVVEGEELLCRGPDGRFFEVRASSRPVRDHSGNAVAAVLTLEDITKYKLCLMSGASA
jgi:PAS domain-containing protein